MATDFVVIGRRQQHDGGGVTVASLYLQGAAVGGNQVVGDFNYDGADDGADTVTVAVNVDVADNSKLDAAETAAENVARALAEIKEDLEADPNATAYWNGEAMPASEALDLINSTKWIISDNPDYNNGGVGGANAQTNSVQLDYRRFDGDTANGSADYAHPNYQNDEALKAILLHEVAHLSDEGYNRWGDSIAYYLQEEGSYGGFYTDSSRFSYRIHLEKFANEFAYAAGNAFLSEDLSGINLTYGTGSMDPIDIHIMNMNWSPPAELTDVSIA